jgi:hypothetical protein
MISMKPINSHVAPIQRVPDEPVAFQHKQGPQQKAGYDALKQHADSHCGAADQ